jgi:UDP-N-acetylmuramate--alanine ligase
MAIGDNGVGYAGSVTSGVEILVRDAREGDVIVTLGAGNVSHAAAAILEALEK